VSAVAQPREVVTVYAAASLKDALDELLKAQGSTRAVYASSATLARQIENGAPADVFIAADHDWMDYLEGKRRLRPGSRVNWLSNRLVLIAPADSVVRLALAPKFALAPALGAGRLAIADPASVPAGKYGKAALESLGVWSAVAHKLAPSENVRAALLLVVRGETPLGIVYASDAQVEPKVRVVGEFPPNTHPPIVYPAALLAASRAPRAQAVLDALRAHSAMAVWRRHGFVVTPG
jgi:molybdate transport system substrate-binding protein